MKKAIALFLYGTPRVKTNQWRGRFWHTAILYNGTVYETLANGRYRKTNYFDWPLRTNPNIAVTVPIDPQKLEKELTSGTDCATYVARVTGLDNSSGSYKNPSLYPEDVLNLLLQKRNVSII